MMTPSVSLAVATIAIVMWIALVVAIFYYKPFHDLTVRTEQSPPRYQLHLLLFAVKRKDVSRNAT
jgi:predicted transporter